MVFLILIQFLNLFMKKIFIFLVTMLLPLPLVAQMFFENAYVIDSWGNRRHVQIKNEGWIENPTTIIIKDESTGKESALGLTEIDEFGLENGISFRKFTLPVAHYEDDLNKIDSNPDFSPQTQTVFLKQLTAGAVSLYSYHRGTTKFFIGKNRETPTQLWYKRYYNSNNDLQKNRTYQTQLSQLINCPNTSFNNIDYKTDSLTKLVMTFNNGCVEPEQSMKTKTKIRVHILAEGHMISTTANANEYYLDNIEMDPKQVAKIGVELEYVLPILSNSFSVFTAPKYYRYKNDFVREYSVDPHTQTVAIDASILEIPVGFRYYNYFNGGNALFLSFAYVLNNTLKSTMQVNALEYDLAAGGVGSFHVGLGYRYRKFMAEIQYERSGFQSTKRIRNIRSTGFGVSLKYNMF